MFHTTMHLFIPENFQFLGIESLDILHSFEIRNVFCMCQYVFYYINFCPNYVNCINITMSKYEKLQMKTFV